MAKRKRRGWTAARLAKAGLLGGGALALAWLILDVSGPNALPRHVVERLGLDAGDPQLVFRQAGQELIASRGRLDEAAYGELVAAMKRQPLAAAPFFFYGFRALGAGNLPLAERLLQEARARNPRLWEPRIALVGTYLRLNRVAEASREIASFVRLAPRAGEALLPELARLAMSPQSRPALIDAFGADPLMADLLLYMARNNASPDLILEVGRRQPLSPDGRFAAWQSAAVGLLVERGEIARAQSVWRRFAGAQGSGSLIYDPGFRGMPGGEPFNWYLASDAVGSAERAQGGGLEVDYFGRQTGALARQLLVLPPGSYRLSFRAEGSANAQGGKLLWRVDCQRGATLLEVPLESETYAPRGFEGRFTVPAANCPAQMLQLMGQAGEFPTSRTARITDLALERIGS